MALSHDGLFGETTAIIDRCIFESCINIMWLTHNDSNERVGRFIADGLKADLELKDKILANVERRAKAELNIEQGMLKSIDNAIKSSGLSESEIKATKKLPSLSGRIEQLGHDRLMYTVGQRMGSHHVHGTWGSLQMHYLEKDESGESHPRDHDCSTHVNQYVFIPLFVLEAMESFLRFISKDDVSMNQVLGRLSMFRRGILEINKEVVGDEFERVADL